MKILVALDGSEAAYHAFKSACHLARGLGAYIVAFHVNKGEAYVPEVTGWIAIKDRIARELETSGQEIIHKAYEIGKACGISVEGMVSEGIPVEEMLKFVNTHGIVKLVAMGHSSKGRGAQEFVASTTRHFLAGSRVPVFVASREIEVRNILVVVDRTAPSTRAVAYAGSLAKSLKTSLKVLSFVPDVEASMNAYKRIAEVPNIERHLEASQRAFSEAAEQTLLAARELLDSMDVQAQSAVITGEPADKLVAEARQHDLLVMGLRGGAVQRSLDGMEIKLLDSREIGTIFVQ